MPDLSKLIFFTSLSASRRFSRDIRVAFTKQGETSRQWIDKHTRDSILDFGRVETTNFFTDNLTFDPVEWQLAGRLFKAFTARELHYHVSTEIELHRAIVKAIGFMDGTEYQDLDHVLDAYDSNLDLRFWIDIQGSRFVMTDLSELLTDWFVLTSSIPVHDFNEYLFNPIHGQSAAIAAANMLNDAVALDDQIPESTAFFAVRLGDLPATLVPDDDELSLLDWICNKQLIPASYTTDEKIKVLSANNEIGATWAEALKARIE